MDILKLNKVWKYVVFIILLVLISSCENRVKEMQQQEDMCYNDTVMRFSKDSLSIRIEKKGEGVKKIKITHIRNGEQNNIESKYQFINNPKKSLNSNIFSFKNLENLYTHDTIQLIVNDTLFYNLTNFRNSADFGGNRFLGCKINLFTVNDKLNDLSGFSCFYFVLR